MIPAYAKSAVVGHSEAVNLEQLSDAPCKYYPKYKGLRCPSCGCRACMEKYLDSAYERGKSVMFSAETLRAMFCAHP